MLIHSPEVPDNRSRFLFNPYDASHLSSLQAEKERLVRSVHAYRTVDGYASDWRIFSEWCAAQGRAALPASTETVVLYITDRLTQGGRVRTARRNICAITHYHKESGYPSPCKPDAYTLVRGAQRLRGEQPRQKIPISLDDLRRMVACIDTYEPVATRNRALLLFGFATALRRITICELQLADVEPVSQGLLVHVRHEKQDQEGIGRTLGVPFGKHADTCPVRALNAWIDLRGREPGYLFHSLWHRKRRPERRLHPMTIGNIVQHAAASIGLEPSRYGAHSLRAGFITESLTQGVGEIVTARHTGHRSLATLKLYMRPQNPFQANACAQIGL